MVVVGRTAWHAQLPADSCLRYFPHHVPDISHSRVNSTQVANALTGDRIFVARLEHSSRPNAGPDCEFRFDCRQTGSHFSATLVWRAADKTGAIELGRLPRHFWKIGQVLTQISNSGRVGYF
jgi:hypothetical protein